VEEGRSFVFIVQVSSEAPVTYQWYFNGNVILDATQGRLELSSVVLAQAGSYQVVVSNFSGSVTSTAATLRLSGGTISFAARVLPAGIDAPVFDLDGTTKLAGNRYQAQLYAGPTVEELMPVGTPRPFLSDFLAGYWSAQSVVLPNVGPGQAAFVQVKAWDGTSGTSYEQALAANGKTGASALLQVQAGGEGEPPSFPADLVGLQSFQLEQGPVFIQQPGSLVLFVGQTAVFAAAATSVTPISYQWQFNGADLAGATGPTLELPNVRIEQAGVYQLVARNATRPITSAAATLVVQAVPTGASLIFRNRVPEAGLDAPVFDTDGVTRLSGNAFVAQLYAGASQDAMEAVGKPAPFGTGAEAGYWQMEDEFWRIIPSLAGGERAYVQVKVWEWAKGESFEAAKAAGGKVGESEVLELVTGGAGTPPGLPAVLAGLQSFRVGRMPVITRQPVGGLVMAGQNFAFDVRATYAAAYQWLFNGAELAGAIGAGLALTNVQPAQAGAYQVVVSNFVGSVTSATCWLQVSTLTSGGTIWFNNHVTSPLVQAPVYDVNGVTRLAGTNFLAQLWVGPGTNDLAAVGEPVPFSTGALAGYVAAGASAKVAATNVGPGALAFVQMRAWEANAGATYEDAVMGGGKYGASDIISVIAGGVGEPPSSPAYLVGLSSFRLRQAPVIVAQTGDIIVDEGQQLFLEVAVDSGSPVTYQWQQEAAAGAWQNISGATSFRLWLGTAAKQMEGGYRVIARNQDGTTTGQAMYAYVSRRIFVGRAGWEDLRLELTGEDGPVYLVEISTNLISWSGLGLITNETAALEFSDPTAANLWARFYRAKSVQSGAVVSKAAAGFVVLEFPYGFSMRANQLLTGNDTVWGLLGTLLPDGVMLYKYNGTKYEINTYFVVGAESLWGDPNMTLEPGEGFIVRNAYVDTYYLAIVGQVPEGRLVNQIPVGWSMQASQVPQAGRLDLLLGLPLVHGDNIDLYITELYDYEAHVTDGAGNWPIGGPPMVWLGESFWIYTSTAREWVREFSTRP
jgi:sulfur relay (sulfurtransferase) DsrF/TusC family protein